MKDDKTAREIGKMTKRGLLRGVNARLRHCHFGWLVVGIIAGWPIDWLVIAIQASLNGVAPIIGPIVADAFLGPLDELVVAVLPWLCMMEISRRLGIGDGENNKKESE